MYAMHIVCMKRTNVVLDEKLLEDARRASGERTYSGAITKALEEYVRRHSFREALSRLQEAATEGPIFYPGYADEVSPPETRMSFVKPKRISADEKRAPRKKSRGRRSR